jgi:hypothetical protein
LLAIDLRDADISAGVFRVGIRDDLVLIEGLVGLTIASKAVG